MNKNDKISEFFSKRIENRLLLMGISEPFQIKCGYTVSLGEYATVKIWGQKYSCHAQHPAEFDCEVDIMIHKIQTEYIRRARNELTRSRKHSKE